MSILLVTLCVAAILIGMMAFSSSNSVASSSSSSSSNNNYNINKLSQNNDQNAMLSSVHFVPNDANIVSPAIMMMKQRNHFLRMQQQQQQQQQQKEEQMQQQRQQHHQEEWKVDQSQMMVEEGGNREMGGEIMFDHPRDDEIGEGQTQKLSQDSEMGTEGQKQERQQEEDQLFLSDTLPPPQEPVLCSQEMNAWCPPKNLCCPQFERHHGVTTATTSTIVGYTCLGRSKSTYPLGTCCSDTNALTGCAVGYKCSADAAAPSSSSSSSFLDSIQSKQDEENKLYCQKDEDAHPVDNHGKPISILYDTMPRYKTCPAFGYEDIAKPFGLAIPASAAGYHHRNDDGGSDGGGVNSQGGNHQDGEDGGYIGRLAYFSNMGPVTDESLHDPHLPLSYLENNDPSSSSSSEDVHVQQQRRMQHLELKRQKQKREQSAVTMAVVVIHGSGRDASSYLCSMIGTVEGISSASSSWGDHDSDLEMRVENAVRDFREDEKGESSFVSAVRRLRRREESKDKSNAVKNDLKTKEGSGVLVIAPWFLVPKDGDPRKTPPSLQDGTTSSDESFDSLPFLHWDDDHPIEHNFRYGAESLPNSHSATTISSFGTMDVLLEALCDNARFPNLEKIVVTGHSAGGQFVQRWGVSSNSWCFGDGDNVEVDRRLPQVRLVPANPRSYVYLDARRYLPLDPDSNSSAEEKDDPTIFHRTTKDANDADSALQFRLPNPSKHELENCTEYNKYEWGLEENPKLPAPYIITNTKKLMKHDEKDNAASTDIVFRRYANREVIYLSGERDTEILHPQICKDDGYQGQHRRERSERFYASLQVLGMEDGNSETKDGQVHERILVKDVAHDHSLMFQSDEGMRGLFDFN